MISERVVRQERPVGVVLLAVAHLGIGGLASALLAVGIGLRIATEGIHLLELLTLVVIFTLGPGLGIGFLFRRAWAWFTATLLYLLVAATGGLSLWFHDLVPADTTAIQALGAGVLGLYVIVACVLYGLLFTTSILEYFGRAPRDRRWVLPAELVGLLLIAVSIGAWVAREERASEAAMETSANLPVIRQIGERGGTASDLDAEFLLERLESGDAEERLNVAWALGQCGRPETIEPLTRVAREDDDSNVRINAVASLVQLGGLQVGPTLVELLDDPDAQVQQAALRGLADETFRSLAPEIGRLLDDESAEIRSMAVDVLGNMADPVAIPVLREATEDSDPDIRGRAAFALGKLGDASAADALVALLDDSSWEVRANAAQALGMVEAREARDALRDATNDPNVYVRDAARAALGRLR